ncbi:hypothetical protein T484DRAFT_1788609 [Baffinella frigidus]|nr:hypothetical protein T484DRAFT_1788609 [Cryptophyta sp. CCMP2293]
MAHMCVVSCKVVAARTSTGERLSSAFVWVKSSDTCAGLLYTCNSGESCTKTALGPCAGGGASAGAIFHVETSFSGMAFVKNIATYTTDATQSLIFEKAKSNPHGYRDFAPSIVVDKETSYSFAMVGAAMGNTSLKTGGYVGITGFMANKGDMSIKEVDVFLSTAPGKARVMQEEEEMHPAPTYQDFAPLDDSYKYMGARMKMTLVGAEATGLTFNGGIK